MASAAAAKMAALHAAATGLRPCPAISPVANRWGILYTTPCEFKVLSMRDILQDFKFMPDGATNLVDALCRFIKEGITFGRITGGEKLPTIGEMCKATGLTFAQARRVTECLAREGYVCSRPHVGTIVLSRNGNVLRGRVLLVLPDADIGRYHPSQMIDVVSRRLMAAGYSFSVVTFPLDANDDPAALKSELLRAADLVIAARATPQVQKCLAELCFARS